MLVLLISDIENKADGKFAKILQQESIYLTAV